MVERLLIRGVGSLQVVHHQVAMTHGTPSIAVLGNNVENALKVVDGLLKVVKVSVNAGNGAEGRDRVRVVSEGSIVGS